MPDGDTDEPPRRRSRTSGDVDGLRAAIVVLVFVASVIVLLGWYVPRHQVTTSPTTTTSTLPTRPVVPSHTNVQVANGTSVANLAGTYTTKLEPYGWVMQPATDAHVTSSIAKTVVYFTPTWQPAAKTVAEQLGLNPATSVRVRNAQTAHLVPGSANDQVVVVVGLDLSRG